jgi:hypothetical protein
MSFAQIMLWLFVINLGIAFGAGIYEARVVVPLWTKAPPESLLSPDSGRKFWGLVTTVPLTLLSIANFVIVWRAAEPLRVWWLGSAAVILVERAFTFAYFIPTMIRLQRATLPQTHCIAAVSRWVQLNYLRNALTLIGWLTALKALTSAT